MNRPWTLEQAQAVMGSEQETDLYSLTVTASSCHAWKEKNSRECVLILEICFQLASAWPIYTDIRKDVVDP